MSTENATSTRDQVSAEQPTHGGTAASSLGERMMNLRLELAEGRITREEYWRAVDALGPQEVPPGGRMP
jgi:hypothetical protein